MKTQALAALAALFLLCSPCCARALAAGKPLKPDRPVPDYVQRLLSVAAGEIGYREERDRTTKYGQWAGDPKAEWCSEFLCWCVARVDKDRGSDLLNRVFPLYTSSNTGRDWFLQKGRYIARSGYLAGWGTQWYVDGGEPIPKNGYVPQPGDWVFLSYFSSGDTSHVALVENCVRADDGAVWVNVIEGNNPDSVQRASLQLSDWRIQGYGTVRDLADLVLRPGCEGEKVGSLQSKLIAVELMDPGGRTGVYGPKTADAVKAFQTLADQAPTGIANRQTQIALDGYLRTWMAGHIDCWTVDGSR